MKNQLFISRVRRLLPKHSSRDSMPYLGLGFRSTAYSPIAGSADDGHWRIEPDHRLDDDPDYGLDGPDHGLGDDPEPFDWVEEIGGWDSKPPTPSAD